ncbi:Transposase, partial [Operophtera brumata]
ITRKRPTKRESNLYNKCRQHLRHICKLKKQIRNNNKTEILKCLASDKVVEELYNKLTNPFAVLLQGHGMNSQIFDVLKKKTAKETPQKNECILLFDEMSIRKHLK